jgi:hypothetical protein
MAWKWDPQGRANLNSIIDTPADMQLTSGRGTDNINIKQKETSEACKSLGCYPAFDGNQTKQYEVLLKKAIAFVAAARHRATTKTDAYMKHNVFFMPTMTFPLGVADIEHKDLQVIKQKFLKPTKQQVGFRSTTSNALMFAPRHYLGVGLRPCQLSVTCYICECSTATSERTINSVKEYSPHSEHCNSNQALSPQFSRAPQNTTNGARKDGSVNAWKSSYTMTSNYTATDSHAQTSSEYRTQVS